MNHSFFFVTLPATSFVAKRCVFLQWLSPCFFRAPWYTDWQEDVELIS